MDYSSVFVCLMGMGTVFIGLICLIALTSLMGRILGKSRKADPVASSPPPAPAHEEAAPAVSTPEPAPAPEETVAAIPCSEPDDAEPIDGNIVAAVSAAIAEDLGIDITGLRIVSMKKLYDGEVVAAVSAAVAEELGVDITNLRIVSMKKL